MWSRSARSRARRITNSPENPATPNSHPLNPPPNFPHARSAHLLLATVTLATGSAQAGVTFGPPRLEPGQTVRLLVQSEVRKGTIESSSPSGLTSGSIQILRDRDLLFTVQRPAADGSPRAMLRVPRFESTTTIDLGGAPDTTTERSPLAGMQLAAVRDAGGSWIFTGNGRPIGDQAKTELEELNAYQSRKWFPERELQIGDSWEFDPAWLRLVVQRDLRDAQMVGTMKLRQVRRTRIAQTAIVDLSVESSGAKTDLGGRSTGATVSLHGEARIDLATMLDEAVELTGTIDMQSHDGGKRTTFHLPIRMTATKTIERPGSRIDRPTAPVNSQPDPADPLAPPPPNSLDPTPVVPILPRNSLDP